MLHTLILSIALFSQVSTGTQYPVYTKDVPEKSMKVYPQTIALGDPIYVCTYAENKADQPFCSLMFYTRDHKVKVTLKHEDSGKVIELDSVEKQYAATPKKFVVTGMCHSGTIGLSLPSFQIGPHKKIPIFLSTVSTKYLNEEDLSEIEAIFASAPKSNSFEKFQINVEVAYPPSETMDKAKESHFSWADFNLSQEIRILPRELAEVEKIQELMDWQKKDLKMLLKSEKELPEGTVRDEIRLTRIMTQYSDTEDEAVLSELTDWFKDMNEIQRTVMAKKIRGLAWNFRGSKPLEPYKTIYGAIKEYDVIDITDTAESISPKPGCEKAEDSI